MHFDLKAPCSDCPFLKKGGVRLTARRVEEIAGNILSSQGGSFACHKTTRYSDDTGDMERTEQSRHCAGALIFAEKNRNSTQMMRIAERLGIYDPRPLMANRNAVERVFGSLADMLRVNAQFMGEGRRKK